MEWKSIKAQFQIIFLEGPSLTLVLHPQPYKSFLRANKEKKKKHNSHIPSSRRGFLTVPKWYIFDPFDYIQVF